LEQFLEQVRKSLKIKAPLDDAFIPVSQFIKVFEKEAEEKSAFPVAISIERSGGLITTFKTICLADQAVYQDLNIFYIERIVKSLIWTYGGFNVKIGAPLYIGEAIKRQYTTGGLREFDFDFVNTVYKQTLTIEAVEYENVPASVKYSNPIGRNFDGCRLGFDAGGSDLKISAVLDGKAVFSKEVVWQPKIQSDPEYHFKYIVDVLKEGASHLPRVDAVGISSAGIYIDNHTVLASLFIKVSKEDFDAKIRDIYIRAVKTLGDNIPVEIANDGDVTALAGAINLEDTNVLGIAMGTSEAAGFVDAGSNITGWLNELAFVPCDLNRNAMIDEWSGDYGCGVKYFSQDAVIKLAPAVGISFAANMTPSEKLKYVQGLIGKDPSADKIFQTIGVYLGYGLAYYSKLYDIKHVLILGRVTSGAGGHIILDEAEKVLSAEFPSIKIVLHLPDESARRVGQSIAAASLPKI